MMFSPAELPPILARRVTAAAAVPSSPTERLRRIRLYQLRQSMELRAMFRVIEKPKEDLCEFTAMEQLALLRMLFHPVAMKVAAILTQEENLQDIPRYGEYSSLRENGLCIQPEGSAYHHLTAIGRQRARGVLGRLCRKFNVHSLITEQHHDCVTYRCSCGQWSRVCVSNPGRYQFQRMNTSWSNHVPKDARETA